MKNRSEKRKELEALKAELGRAKNVIVSSFSGMTVAQDYELRKQLRAAGSRYRVVKNTLAELAARGTAAESVLKGMRGPTALAYTEGDPVTLAKALTAYSKANPILTFKAGVVEGRVISIDEIFQLATMPGKPEIIARLLFLISAPAQRLASALGGVSRNLAVAIDQAAKENKFAGQ
jgi:large subunit ribosomal protein L10